jgi:hypothetical protein
VQAEAGLHPIRRYRAVVVSDENGVVSSLADAIVAASGDTATVARNAAGSDRTERADDLCDPRVIALVDHEHLRGARIA